MCFKNKAEGLDSKPTVHTHVMAYAGKPIVLEGGNIKNKELKIILDYEASLNFLNNIT